MLYLRAERLRAHTRRAHRQLDRSLKLLTPSATRDDYECFLQRLHAFHRVVEAQLESLEFRLHMPDWSARKRAHLAELDLHYLGLTELECEWVPALVSLPQQLGAAYVFEGATLGGQVIAAQVSKRFGIPPEGLRYMRAYGEETATMWARFKTQLEQVPLSESQWEQVLDASESVFASLRTWLDSFASPSASPSSARGVVSAPT